MDVVTKIALIVGAILMVAVICLVFLKRKTERHTKRIYEELEDELKKEFPGEDKEAK